MKKAYLYRLYPTAEQAALLQQQLDVARDVYNACLLERREAYRMAGVTLNAQHQTAHKLVQAFDVICHEALAIKNMVRNHSLARSISDAAWGQFIAILVGKAEGAGRQTIAVNPRDTSQTCVCGELVPKDLSERWHHCPRCGLSLPRDQVSAMLIKALGLEMLANTSGLGSSPQAPTWPAGACVT